ncbi:MAG TPA: hypothetical protein VMT99_02640 [Candidatus Paceibacterota bacterium]|nr:hypothetical protein [Candidatus Paceibacterota bacterium]
MIIFLYGPDDYRREQKKKDIIAEFRKKRSDLGLGFFDLASKDAFDSFGAFVRNQPMFETAKLAVIENAFEAQPEKLKEALKPVVAAKGLQVLVAERDKPLKALAFLLDEPVLSQKFEVPAGAEFVKFVNGEAKKRDLVLEPSAAAFLASVYEGQTWAVITELDKLASFKAVIAKSDLDDMGLAAAPNYWALIQGLKGFDVRNRLTALETLFAINDPAAKIFNIVAAQAGSRMPLVAQYDVAIKSGRLEYEEVLVDFALG